MIRVPYEDFFPALNTMATDVAADCVLDIAYGIIQIVMFLYYWQATEPAVVKPELGLTPLEDAQDRASSSSGDFGVSRTRRQGEHSGLGSCLRRFGIPVRSSCTARARRLAS